MVTFRALVAIGVMGVSAVAARADVLAAIERVGEEGSGALAQVYAYEPTIPLEARVVEKVEQNGQVREKIVFRGVQGALASGYLQLPTGAGPFPCVLLLHGWSGSNEAGWQDDNYISGGNARRALLAQGMAVLALDAQCHGDRIASNDFAPVNHYLDPASGDPPRKGYFTQQDIYVQTVRDYRRAIDYLHTRVEIIKDRIGVLGYSMGGTQTFVLMGVDPRIRAAVAVATPAEKSKWSPIAPQNFVVGIGKRPLLTIIGRRDELCPLEHAQALQRLLPEETSRQILYDAPHRLTAEWVPQAVDWLQKHL